MSFISLHYIFPLVLCDHHDRVACTDPCFKLTKEVFLVLCTWIFTYKAPLQQEILLIRIKNGLLMCIPSISTTMQQLAHFSYVLLQMMIIVQSHKLQCWFALHSLFSIHSGRHSTWCLILSNTPQGCTFYPAHPLAIWLPVGTIKFKVHVARHEAVEFINSKLESGQEFFASCIEPASKGKVYLLQCFTFKKRIGVHDIQL